MQSRQREGAEFMARRSAKNRAVEKHLDRVEIKILPTAPVTAEEFNALYNAHRRERLNTGVMAYFRHHHTNYDKVLTNSFNRWGVDPSSDVKERLRKRIDALAAWYFREIGMPKPEVDQRRYLVVCGPRALDFTNGQNAQ
jgi:hypothetical protein